MTPKNGDIVLEFIERSVDMKYTRKHYIKLCCEEIFREFEKEQEDLRHLIIDIYKTDDGLYEINVEGETEEQV